KWADAEGCCREAIRLKPDYANAHYSLARVLTLLCRPAEAAASYREAIRLKPDYANAHNDLAWFLATCPDPAIRDPGQAVEHARRAVALAPKVGGYWNTLGVAVYRSGD